MIRLYSVDDDDKFAVTLSTIFAPYTQEFELVGSYGLLEQDKEMKDLIDTIEKLKPDIVLMDFDFSLVNLPADYGVELTRKIIDAFPDQKIIMLVSQDPFNNHELFQKIERAFDAGASGFMRKDEPLRWMPCIRECVTSQINPDLVLSIPNSPEGNRKKGKKTALTDREITVIMHLADDKIAREISPLMSLSSDGLNYHINNAKAKLGVKTLQGLVGKALREGYIG